MTTHRLYGPIYLDYNATTPVDPAVGDAMLPFLTDTFGNPSSSHAYGSKPAEAVAEAREHVAALIGAQAGEIVFTGCGSEADNLAILGAALAGPKRHVITQATEHPAVLAPARYLAERLGGSVTVLPVDGYGLVDPDAVRNAITPETVLVSIMHANNETGTIQPIVEIAAICKAAGVLLHTDAAQSIGKVPVNVDTLGVDLLTVVGHKVYAPKGVAALYVRNGVRLDSFLHGGGQEHGRRAGTENVAGIVALGAACAIAAETNDTDRLRTLRDRLERHLLGHATLNGHPTERLPNTLNLRFTGQDGEAILRRIPEIAASTGSACHSDHTDPSPVLLAMGINPADALGAVRLSLGRWSTESEVDSAAAFLMGALQTAA